MNIFAIGDVHGCLKELNTLYKKIVSQNKFDQNNDLLIFLGDYIDRGPNSKQVIDKLIELREKNSNTKFLMGNHEEFICSFLFDKINNIKNWLNFGADQTFRSYGIELVEYIKDGFDDATIDRLRDDLFKKMSDLQKDFYSRLDLYFATEKYLFLHAGVNNQKKIEHQSKKDLLWHRSEKFFNINFKYDKVVVHGHTPEENVVNHPFRINIDTGCYFSGKLSCVLLNSLNDQREFLDTK